MSLEVVCQACGTIARALIPLVKEDDSIVYTCGDCNHSVIRIFGTKSLMTEYIRKTGDNTVR